MISKNMFFEFIYIILLFSAPLNEKYHVNNGISLSSTYIDEDIEKKLIEDFRLFLIERYGDEEYIEHADIWISTYFGNYSGCEVVYIANGIIGAEDMGRYVGIAGYWVVYPDYHEVYVYKDSMFYTIKEAYEMRFINENDVYDIAIQISPATFKEYNNIQ